MNEDLRETADRMTAKAAELREQEIRHLNHDGTCRIVKIDRNVFAPLLAEVTTDLDEHLGVYRADLLDWLTTAQRSGRRVKLTLARNFRHHRYIASVAMLPVGTEPEYPCVNCGALVSRRADGQYACGACHYIMHTS